MLHAGGFKFVLLLISATTKTGNNFLASCKCEEQYLQMFIENEVGKELWDEMNSDTKQRRL